MLLTIVVRPLTCGCAAGVEDDRPRALLLQPLVDVPDQPLAAFLVGFGRWSPELFFELAIAVAGEVAVGIAGIALVKLLVGIVVHALALDVFYVAARTGSVVRIAPSAACLERSAEGIEESKARTQLAAMTKAVRKRLPKDPDKLWGWLIDRDQPQRIDQELASGQNHVILFLRSGLRLAEGPIEE